MLASSPGEGGEGTYCTGSEAMRLKGGELSIGVVFDRRVRMVVGKKKTDIERGCVGREANGEKGVADGGPDMVMMQSIECLIPSTGEGCYDVTMPVNAEARLGGAPLALRRSNIQLLNKHNAEHSDRRTPVLKRLDETR